jgi:hypothetical protein
MELYDALKQFVEKIANEQKTIIGKVRTGSVNESNGSCIVDPLNGEVEVPEARFSVDLSGATKLIPQDDSIVVVQMYTPTAGVIVAYSKVKSIELNGDQNGGLVIVTSLLSKINALENELNTLKTIFASWVVVPTDGGAALKATAASWAAQQLVITQQQELENKTVKHGYTS